MKLKRIIAFALAMTMLTTTAYAAEVPQAEQTLPILTFEDALEKVKKHDVSLRNLSDQNDLLRKTKGDVWDQVGGFSLPDYSYQYWVDDMMYSYYSMVQSVESGLATSKHSEKLLHLTAELTVMNSLMTICISEDGYKLMQDSFAVTQLQYNQGVVRHRLGLISAYELSQLKMTMDKAQLDLDKMALSIDALYIGLNNLMGEAADKRYEIEYDATYEKYELSMNLDQYINNSLRKDYTILIKEQAVEDTKFTMNVLAESDTNTQSNSRALSHTLAKRELKTAKENKESAIRTAFSAIQQADIDYANALKDLESAKEDLRVVELNYRAGNITKLTLDSAALQVAAREQALEQLAYTYELQVFMFENTSLLNN